MTVTRVRFAGGLAPIRLFSTLPCMTMRFVTGLCTVALVCTATPAVADSGSQAPAKLTARVSSAKANATIAFLLPLRVNNPRIGTTFGLDVVDADSGDPIYSRMADTPLRPASNMKIVTAITALRVLGPHTRMTTDAVVPTRGQVILRGGGDTTLGTAGLSRLASATAKYLTTNDLLPVAAKRRPAVQVFVDDSLYGKPKRGPGWTSSYQPSIARPVRPLGRLGVYQWDSASEAGSVFAAALRSRGVKARLVGHRDAAPDAPAAAQVTGDTVATQVRYMMQVSENNIAEMLYRQVAVERGRKGTFKGGRLAARDTLRELGLETSGLRLLDGSGLSRDDRLTPRFLTDLLRLALRTDEFPEFKSFMSSLPVGGRTGTLSPGTARYTTAPSKCAAGQVFAKTGTLFDTIGLSGYTRAADGKLKAFSALVNDRPQRYSPLATRQAVDGLVATVNGCWGPTSKTGQPPG